MKSTANHQHEHLTQCFDEGVHPSWATSPWSIFHGLGLYIRSMWKKFCLQSSMAPDTYTNVLKMSKLAKNDYWVCEN